VKTAISIPDDVFKEAERAAKRLGISRSELFTQAVRRFLETQRNASITRSYDAAFGPEKDDDTATFRREAARRRLLDMEW
jgi:hypothetical protein